MATYYVDVSVGNDGNAGTSPGAGNAWATLSHAFSTATDRDTIYVKASGAYTTTTTLTPPSSGLPNNSPTRVIGYNTTVTDNGRVSLSTSSAIDPVIQVNGSCVLANFSIDGGNTAVTGITTANRGAIASNCKVQQCTTNGINSSNGSFVFNCEVTNLKTGASYGIISGHAVGCYIHDSPGVGMLVDQSDHGAAVIGCVIANMLSDGVQMGALGHCLLLGCSIYGNGGDGVDASNGSYESGSVLNCVIYGNGGYGINWGFSIPQLANLNYNALGSNTSGDYHNVSAGPNDVSLSGNPFTNVGTGDYSLNNTAGAGAACRSAAYQL